MYKKYFYATAILLLSLAIGIQPTRAIDIPNENPAVGTWTDETTYTLIKDFTEGLVVVESNFILSGNGHTVTGLGSGDGVLLSGVTGVTVKNLNVLNFSTGICLQGSSNNTITNLNVTGCGTGIWLASSNNCNVSANIVSNNGTNGISLQESSGNTITGNNVSDDDKSGTGIHLVDYSNENTLENNDVSGSGIGILISTYSSYNAVTSNKASGNKDGISIYMYSHNNNLDKNTVSDNTQYGIELEISKDYTLTSNTVSNNYIGIRVNGSGATDPNVNTMTDNTVSNNVGGIYLNDSSKNQIYNNNLIVGETTLWLAHMYENCSGNVFDLGDPVTGGEGGNYWSDYTGQDRGDGIGDTPYTFTDGKDNYPWVVQDGWISNQPPVADAGDDQLVECACQTGGTQVTLDGIGSTDPDEDPLTYTWTGPFDGGTASGATPTVTLDPGCPGDYVISLVVNDGELDSEDDTVTITVVDTTPPDITCPGYLKIELQGPDGVPVDDERIQTFLNGASATDNCDPEPSINNDAPAVFPPGDTIVTFLAEDASGNSSSCSATVTVVEAAEANLRIIPSIINREGRLERILAVIRFPEGVTEDDIDIDQPLMLFPGDSLDGIEALSQRIVTWYTWGTLRVSIFATFDKDEVTAAVPEDDQVEMMLIGRFVSGQYFYGLDTVRIISWSWRR